MNMHIRTLLALVTLMVLQVHAEDAAAAKDLKQLGQERTACYNAALKNFAHDRLLQKLVAEEAELGREEAAAKQAGKTELTPLLTQAKTGKHMEKRYYLCLLDPVFGAACRAYNDADPGFQGLRSKDLAAVVPAK